MFEQDRIITGRKDKNLLIFKAEDIRWELLFDLSDKQFKRPLHGGRTKLVAETGVKKFFRRCNLRTVADSFDNPEFKQVFGRLVSNGRQRNDNNGYRRRRRGRVSNFGTLFAEISDYMHFESYHLLGIRVPAYGMPIKKHVSTYPKHVIRFMRESGFEFGGQWEDGFENHPKLIENLCAYVIQNHHDNLLVYKHFFDIVEDSNILHLFSLLIADPSYKSEEYQTRGECGFGADYKSLFDYVIKCIATEAMTPEDVIQEYFDYLKMARKIKQVKQLNQLREQGDDATQLEDLPIIDYRKIEKYPVGLSVRHRIVTRNFNVMNQRYDEEKFTKLCNPDYQWSDKEFCMVTAKRSDDIKNEGTELNHCVGSYIESVLQGRTQIMFMRRAETPETSFITVEVRSRGIQQARGYANRVLNEEEKRWLEKYAKKKNLSYGSVVSDEEKLCPMPTPNKKDFIGPWPLVEKEESDVE